MQEKQTATVAKTAGLLMLTMAISRVLGYVRDSVILNKIGQNRITDIYNAAFLIPDLLFAILISGALSAAVIPVFSQYIAKGQKKEGWKTVSIAFNWIMSILLLGVILGEIFTPQLVSVIVPGFDAESAKMTVDLSRIMFLQVVFLSFAGFSMAVLHSHKIFAPSAFANITYNLGTILGGLFLAAPIEKIWPGYGIAGFSVGVVIGALTQFLVQVPALGRLDLAYHRSFDFRQPGVKKMFALMVPIIISLSISELNIFVNINLGSFLDGGVNTAFRIAQRLMLIPTSIFGLPIAIAILPTLSAQFAQRETDDFREYSSMGIRSVLFLCLPVAVGMAVLGTPLIRFMYEFTDKFGSADTLLTSQILVYFCIGLVSYGLVHVLSRIFYSVQDTITPVIMGVVSIAVNILFSLILIRLMAQNGLALAYSLAGIINIALLLVFMRRKLGRIDGRRLLISSGQMLAASAIMGVVVWLALRLVNQFIVPSGKLMQAIELFIPTLLGMGVYVLVAKLWKMEELDQALAMVFKRRKKASALGEG
ncbi:MAG: murein biosynthesis integral membrane protein MurJ [Clostridiales bacterium]|nr:murein biosynthesis integral membrane protein MurJ [Clostridiales bacterium]